MQLDNAKLFDLESARRRRETQRTEGRKVVLTNGCFDLLHTGHLFFLQAAAELGDALWVLINSDESVKVLKGPHRPIQSETERAYALAALSCVDTVAIFPNPRLDAEIRLLRPDIYTKAGDYSLESIHVGEREALENVGADIRFLPFLEGFSTTRMIEKIKKAGTL